MIGRIIKVPIEKSPLELLFKGVVKIPNVGVVFQIDAFRALKKSANAFENLDYRTSILLWNETIENPAVVIIVNREPDTSYRLTYLQRGEDLHLFDSKNYMDYVFVMEM